jgi:predicted ATPase
MLRAVRAELDASVLGAGFASTTRWHVLTGAACCGKTTLVDLLSRRGYEVVPEGARSWFQRALAEGRTLQEIRQDDRAVQRAIADLQLRLEQQADPDRPTVLDRALPDSLAFYRLVGLDPNEILPECFRRRYATVLLLDRLPLHRDSALGPEDEESSAFLDTWLEHDYRALGYDVIRVPAVPVEQRLAQVLDLLPQPA